MSGLLMGTMQDRPLMVASMLTHAATFSPAREIVSRTATGEHRYGFADAERRARAAARGLIGLGVKPGDRVATLAWNTHRHFELFYAAPGLGAVLHTVNPRLWEDQIVYILEHAEDKVLAFDPDQLPLVEAIAPRLTTVERYVLLGGADELPAQTSLPLVAYEDLLGDDGFTWPQFDERAGAILCYTSGTTGMPKGVLCSHRALVLHALACQSPAVLGLTARDTALVVVPLFHAYGWGMPFITALAGARLVLPGAAPDSRTIVDLIHAERATLAMGVPTVWTGVFAELEASGRDLGTLERAMIGGSAVPPAMSAKFLERYGVEPATGWGMTELSPVASFITPTPELDALPEAERNAALYGRAGRMMFPVELKIVDAEGRRVPADGVTSGDIWVRGPTVAAGYYKGDGGDLLDAEGFFPTGDVGTLDEFGSIKITDRFKDLIKSGGEWISSADLERLACGCPGVAQAAAIAAPHPKWLERPLLLIVPEEGAAPSRDQVLDAIRPHVARWWVPDDVVTIDALPLTATGKIDKKALRARFETHLTSTLVEQP